MLDLCYLWTAGQHSADIRLRASAEEHSGKTTWTMHVSASRLCVNVKRYGSRRPRYFADSGYLAHAKEVRRRPSTDRGSKSQQRLEDEPDRGGRLRLRCFANISYKAPAGETSRKAAIIDEGPVSQSTSQDQPCRGHSTRTVHRYQQKRPRRRPPRLEKL